MEDLFGKMQEILGSEEGRKQLSDLAGALGAGSLLGDSSKSNPSNPPPTAAPAPSLSPELLFLVQKLFSGMQEDNEDTKLLLALRPHLSDRRQQRIDRAIQLLKLSALLPLLKESGILERWFPHAK